MIDGMTRSGSAAANGMAPSVMNDAPSSQAALPFSRSGTVNRPGRTTVARARAIGGTMPASMTAAMILSSGASVAVAAAPRPAVAKAYATLFSGPPMSKAIIRPRMTPRTMAGAGAAHAVQPVGERLHEPAERPAEHDHHHEARR